MKIGDYFYTPFWSRVRLFDFRFLDAPGVRALWVMASLPVVDGFFLSFLQTGMWQEPAQAFAFGVTALSGGGCVVAAMKLQGSLLWRMAQACAVYLAVALLTLVVAALQPLLGQVIPANLSLFTAIFLLGLGLTTTGLPWLRTVAQWTGFEAAVKVMLVAALLRLLLTPGVDWRPAFDLALLPALALAWGGGAALSLSGVVMGRLVDGVEDRRALDWGGGLSLVLMGLRLLEMPLATWMVLAPLAVGYVWMVIKLWEHKGRKP